MTELVAPFSRTRPVLRGIRTGEPGWYRYTHCRKSREATWRFRMYRLADLKGRIPRRHPEILRGKHGKTLLAVQQTWVENDTDGLWVVKAFRTREDGKREVHLRPYGSWIIARVIPEDALRSQFRVWDKAVLHNKERARMLAAEFLPEEVRRFGFDPETGNRIKD